MCTDKFSIGELIGVHVSGIVNELIRTISSQFSFFFFFCKKILSVQKAPKPKTNDFHPLRSFCASENLLPLLFFVHLFLFLLVGSGLIYLFVHLKSFRKKIINWLEIVVITSFTILLILVFSKPSTAEFIYTNQLLDFQWWKLGN